MFGKKLKEENARLRTEIYDLEKIARKAKYFAEFDEKVWEVKVFLESKIYNYYDNSIKHPFLTRKEAQNVLASIAHQMNDNSKDVISTSKIMATKSNVKKAYVGRME